MTFGTGQLVLVRVQWAVSPDLDVPVHHIKVAWSWTATEDATASSKTKRRKTVRGVSPCLSLFCSDTLAHHSFPWGRTNVEVCSSANPVCPRATIKNEKINNKSVVLMA